MFEVFADEGTREKRKSICFSCEFLIDKNEEHQFNFRHGGCLGCLMSFAFKKHCSVCGCYIIPKAAINSSKCPIDKW